MKQFGIETGADLRACSLDFLERRFGKIGRYYWGIARGIDERSVEVNRERKSVGVETTLAADIFTFEEAQGVMAPLIERLLLHRQALDVHGRTLTIKVKYGDFRQITRSRTFSWTLETKDAVGEAVVGLLAPLFPASRGVRLLGVALSSLTPSNSEPEQMSLPLALF